MTRVVCFCPSGRFTLAPLVLATWHDVREFVLVDDDAAAARVRDVAAVLVMDAFVTRERVERFARDVPVFVLAWNGMFELQRYVAALAGIANVVYVGTDDAIAEGALAERVSYRPMIDGACSFVGWRSAYRDKRAFSAIGNAAYRARWEKNKWLVARGATLVVRSTMAALRRQRAALADAIRSAFITDVLAWAGYCQLDLATAGLSAVERAELARRIDLRARGAAVMAIGALPERMRAARELVDDWRAHADAVLGREGAHRAFYITNTLQRWFVLGSLVERAPAALWLFGADNVGLGLARELDIYRLAPVRRMAFLDFGGKTAETMLYPRALQLLARDCYVIAIAPTLAGDELASVLDELAARLVGDRRTLFDELEARRRALYADVPPIRTLAEMQRAVWSDFAQPRAKK